ncbi:homoserine dehydrogenase [Candidatus Endowatersipora endosymbiont of Watersipora subatra]|uniref:homoserine dehydrogenase n=1 Tax=Candidatus Endowatersipora endosymbiont of Watersipora subatra TaxID=3077946 RepID=UPI00312C792F
MNVPIRIGISGLGTVGMSLVTLIEEKSKFLQERCGRVIIITAINARSRSKDRGRQLNGYQWIDTPDKLASRDNIDVFVELMGGADDPAFSSVRKALNRGKHIVTANTALLAKHGVELAEIAEANGLFLNYEASVAGWIPIIKTMRESLAANQVNRIYGILNGTCNYILTRMENEGTSLQTCLIEAQKLGFAESDPTCDIDGNDSAQKLAILTSLAFGTAISPDSIYLEGIRKIETEDIEAAAKLGYRIKLLSVAKRTPLGLESRVHPALLPLYSPLAKINGVTNAVSLESDAVGHLMMSGPEAGGDATAFAVAADILDIAKSGLGYQHRPPASSLMPYKRAQMENHKGGYFIRLKVIDRPGTMASVATQMAKQGISLQSIFQKQSNQGYLDHQAALIIFITHETTEIAVKEALKAIRVDARVLDSQMIRIEKT